VLRPVPKIAQNGGGHERERRLAAAAFVDGELDLKSQLALERRLADEPALRQQVDELRLLRQELRQHASYHAAPRAVRRRAASLGAAMPPPSPPRRVRRRPACALAAMAAARRRRRLRRGRDARGAARMAAPSRDAALAEEVVASHARATLGQRLVDVASSTSTRSSRTCRRSSTSRAVGPLRLEGSELLGGGSTISTGARSRCSSNRQGRHVVDAYVWPTRERDRPPRFRRRARLTARRPGRRAA
jgi:anti-sigma factor RsiW